MKSLIFAYSLLFASISFAQAAAPTIFVAVKFKGALPSEVAIDTDYLIKGGVPTQGVKCVYTRTGGECSGAFNEILIVSDEVLLRYTGSRGTKSSSIIVKYHGKDLTNFPLEFDGSSDGAILDLL
jgi:hypothetical protein